MGHFFSQILARNRTGQRRLGKAESPAWGGFVAGFQQVCALAEISGAVGVIGEMRQAGGRNGSPDGCLHYHSTFVEQFPGQALSAAAGGPVRRFETQPRWRHGNRQAARAHPRCGPDHPPPRSIPDR